MTKPNFYYRMENYYSNYRDYVKSKSYYQLAGKDIEQSSISTNCAPVDNFTAIDNPLIWNAYPVTLKLNPCGLIAKYFFNDTYEL